MDTGAECMTKCPQNYYGNTKDRTCVNNVACNDANRFLYENLCIDDCVKTSTPPKKFKHQGSCLPECTNAFFGPPTKQGKCQDQYGCPVGFYGDEETHMCIDKITCNKDGKFVYELEVTLLGVKKTRKLCLKQCGQTNIFAIKKLLFHDGQCL